MRVICLFIYAPTLFSKGVFKLLEESGKTWRQFRNHWKLELDVILEITKPSSLYFTKIKRFAQDPTADWKRHKLAPALFAGLRRAPSPNPAHHSTYLTLSLPSFKS